MAAKLLQRSSGTALPAVETRAPDPPLAADEKHELWIAVCFPDLALNAVTVGSDLDPDRPAVAYEAVGQQLRIVAANRAARRLGVADAGTVGAALGFAADLLLYERSTAAEDDYLRLLADRASRFTPSISLQSREGLLLEVGASLALFGGREAICRGLRAEWQRLALEYHISAAPTPLGALWLARRCDATLVQRAELVSRLGELPLAVTGWPEAVRRRLRTMGVRTLGECLRLSRQGFARRVGQRYLDELDRAVGKQPDPRPFHAMPVPITWATDFADETADRAIIGKALESGVAVVSDRLRHRQRQIRQLEVCLEYRRGGSDTIRLEFVEPLHRAEHLLAPLLVRLESMQLTDTVTAVGIETGALLPLQAGSEMLFPDRSTAAESGAVLIECLRSRLGRKSVFGVGLMAEHRPERAFRRLTDEISHATADTVGHETLSGCRRPLWILPAPALLSPSELGSLVRVDDEAERIESGWWDGDDVQRDYYVVRSSSGECWWVYRDRARGEWRLHGIFG